MRLLPWLSTLSASILLTATTLGTPVTAQSESTLGAEITQGDEQVEDLSRVTALQLEEERTGVREEGEPPGGPLAPEPNEAEWSSPDAVTSLGGNGAGKSLGVLGDDDVNALIKRSGCAPSGGVQLDAPAATKSEVNFFGGGWGHGAGLSQYGSLGAVRLGCNYAQILTTYFANTTIKSIPWNDPIRVEAAPDVNTMTLTADAGSIPWQVCNRDGSGCSTVATQPQGQTWVGIRNGGNWVIKRGSSTVFQGTLGRASSQRLRAVLSESNANVMRVVNVKEARYDDGRENRYRWGHLDLMPANSHGRKGNLVLTVPSMNLYLRGLGEISSAWPVEVQKVQAVTARTFVTNKLQTRKGSAFSATCDCDIRSSTSDQYYKGWDHERWDTKGYWRQGIDATGSQNVVINGSPINSYFSAATGGVVTTGDFVWGGTRPPFSKRFDDSRWEQAAKFDRTRWVKGFSKAELGRKLGIGTYVRHKLNGPFEPGGRIGREGVTFVGTSGSVTLKGQDPRFKLGLHSMWFRIDEKLPPIPSGLPQGPDNSGGSAAPAPANPTPAHPMKRVSGSNRVLTAIAAAQHWPQADHVVVASEGDWHGALSAGPYAAAKNAPLLLTNSQTLNTEVANEIRRLKPKAITLVGGHAAVSAQVERALGTIANVTRHFGPTAQDTAVALALHSGSPTDTIVVVSDSAWPDAVSASGLARGVHTPLVLFSAKNQVYSATVDAIRARRPKRIVMVGGTAALSEDVRRQLSNTGIPVERLSGSNRLLTSHAVVTYALGGSKGRVPLIVAGSHGWADALSAGPLAARIGGHVLLVPQATMSDSGDTARTLDATRDRWSEGFIMGGRAAVSQGVQDGLEVRYRN
ncbi:cell wall-binding repeat-containing protein [Stomatohabitans albus]|uniref:cell wall-binding repeat-containing protein n=1 Tax=Stomatohabitans albus TaxID=3110766 RepID=UPI00300C08AE